MDKLLCEQSFYPKLNNEMKHLLNNLFKSYRKKKIINNISIYVYLIIGVIFLLSFKEIMFQKIYISNINFIFNALKIFLIIGGLLSITEIITKSSTKNHDKAKEKLKSYMVMDICKCSKKCTCKEELVKFLSFHGIYLL